MLEPNDLRVLSTSNTSQGELDKTGSVSGWEDLYELHFYLTKFYSTLALILPHKHIARPKP